MNKINYWLTTAAVTAVGAVSALAQDEGSTPEIDLSAAENFAEDLGEKMSDLLTGKVLVAVVGVAAAMVAIKLVPRVWRWLFPR